MISRTQFDLYLKTPRGLIKPRSFNGVVHLLHNENFEIVLSNNSYVKVKAHVFLCGHDIGTLVLYPKQIMSLKKVVEGIDRCFRYCLFDSYEGFMGELNETDLYSDEISVVYMPERSVIKRIRSAIPGGIRVETDYSPAHDTSDSCAPSGSAVLGPNKTYQSFYKVADFITEGEYKFTLVMRTKKYEEDMSPMILPLKGNV